ncbi:MAG: (deoxy)nucleoside triphosphate pyrophosphohydrolase [Planctomycetota bacterium]|nr:MAG: (deoxy)nucleoside triphosphate pyrophosphohydrolase [Planctomycetota bacterium]
MSEKPLGIDVALALVHRRGRWLVARRPDHVHLGGVWEFPGGKCEPGERPQDAAIRELLEECGVQAQARYALPSFTYEYPERTVTITPVVCEWVAGDGEAHASEECRWVTLSQLRRLEMPAANAQVIAELQLYA